MRIGRIEDRYVIERGDEYRPTYFAMWVDADKSCWSRHSFSAAKFPTEEKATAAMARIRAQDKARRLHRQKSCDNAAK